MFTPEFDGYRQSGGSDRDPIPPRTWGERRSPITEFEIHADGFGWTSAKPKRSEVRWTQSEIREMYLQALQIQGLPESTGREAPPVDDDGAT